MMPSVQRDTAVLLVMVALGMLGMTVVSYRESQSISTLFLVMAVLELLLLGLVYLVVVMHLRERRHTQQSSEAENFELTARNCAIERWVGHVRTAARHLLRLITDFLDLFKVEEGHVALQIEQFPVGEALSEHSITFSPPPVPRIVQSRRARPLILVVDDEAPAVEVLRTSLLPDYQVVTASSATQAVRLAKELKPDLLTLDILLPTGSGWAVLAQLKSDAATAAIPVIIVSIVDRKELGFLLGASEYLVKPVSREQLLESVRRHVVPGTERGRVLVGKQVAGD